jgi:arginine decarboxylase
LFPVIPLHRLQESKVDFATLVDVTCDSDGKIDKFVDLKDVKETLELPEWRENEDYYIGLFLLGAYQEVMGSGHNLFGLPNEAQIFMESDGRFHVSKIVPGSRIQEMVTFARFDVPHLQEAFNKRIRAAVESGSCPKENGDKLIQQYASAAHWTTYLE